MSTEILDSIGLSVECRWHSVVFLWVDFGDVILQYSAVQQTSTEILDSIGLSVECRWHSVVFLWVDFGDAVILQYYGDA